MSSTIPEAPTSLPPPPPPSLPPSIPDDYPTSVRQAPLTEDYDTESAIRDRIINGTVDRVDLLLYKQKETDKKLARLRTSSNLSELKECTFQPTINPASREMAESYASSASFLERSYMWQKKKIETRERIHTEMSDESYKECTFHPNVNSKIVETSQVYVTDDYVDEEVPGGLLPGDYYYRPTLFYENIVYEEIEPFPVSENNLENNQVEEEYDDQQWNEQDNWSTINDQQMDYNNYNEMYPMNGAPFLGTPIRAPSSTARPATLQNYGSTSAIQELVGKLGTPHLK